MHRDRTRKRIISWIGSLVSRLYISNANPFGYTYYSYPYQATASTATLTMAFEQDPSFWCLDDISVALQTGGPNLVVDPGFESGALGSYISCNPSGASSSGTVSTTCPNSGWYSYYDGSIGNPDFLSQSFFVTSGSVYIVSFWLENVGATPNSATIIMSE